ncbi:hypothetical protein JCM8547_002407 [Rhodosporidiobolus lusitaniae]
MDHPHSPPSTTTITILPTRLRLLSIPLSLKHSLMSPLLDLLLFRPPSDPFFALCSNGIELSVFAEEKGVRRTFGRYRKRREKGKGKEGKGKGKEREDQEEGDGEEKVVLSDEVWVALEVAFGGSGWEEAGSRVHSLSSPLALRGISILFLSTFYSDYILVRASSLALVTSILEEEGFAFGEALDEREEREVEEFLYDDREDDEEEDSEEEGGKAGRGGGRRSGFTSRRTSRDDGLVSTLSGSLVLSDETGFGPRSASPSSSTNVRRSTSSRSGSRSHSRTHSRAPSPSVSRSNSLNLALSNSSISSHPFPPRQLSSPSSTLPSFTSPTSPSASSTPLAPSPSASTTLPSTAPGPALSLLPDELVCVGLSSSPSTHEALWRQQVIQCLFFPERVLPPSPSSSSSTSPTDPTEKQPPPTPFLALTQTADTASLTADVRLLRAGFLGVAAGKEGREGEEALFASGVGGLGGGWAGEEGVRVRRGRRERRGKGWEKVGAEAGEEGKGGEKTTEEEEETSASEDGESWVEASTGGEETDDTGQTSSTDDGGDEGDEEEEEEYTGERTLLKCLQLDLNRFGLDKPGLVEHYASLLISSGITSLLYQSTFGSANILVAKRDVERARRVLERG